MMKFRFAALAVSAVICSTVLYFAFTNPIHGITDLFEKGSIVDVLKKPPPPPPPPPPPKNLPPPPPPLRAPPVVNAPPVVVDVPSVPKPPPPVAQITDPRWLRRPTADEFADYYPQGAYDRHHSGRVVLSCLVNADGKLSCQVVDESPEGEGFGRAALQVSSKFKIAPATMNGQPTAGGHITIPINFEMPKEG